MSKSKSGSPADANDDSADRLFAERVTRYLDDTLPPDELKWLNRELAASSARRERFVRLCMVESLVAEELSPQAGGVRGAAAESGDLSGNESGEWSGLAALSGGTPAVIKYAPRPFTQRLRIDGRTLGGLAAAAGLLIALSIGWQFNNKPTGPILIGPVAVAPPVRPSPAGPAAGAPPSVTAVEPGPVEITPPAPIVTAVASVSRLRDAVWDGPSIEAGGRLMPGTALALTRGCAAISFDGGTAVIVEGPAKVTIDSAAGLSLAAGKAHASVRGGRFVVTTADAVVTDLGTEFGVAVPSGGGTRVEVFNGSVRLETRPHGGEIQGQAGTVETPLTLVAGEAAFAAKTVARDAAGAVPQHFIRTLDRPTTQPIEIDVVDLVAGGDGLSHRRGRGIDIIAGTVNSTPIGSFVGKHGYQRVTGALAVDGAFVPDQNAGPTTIDSAGNTFAFPVTDNHAFALLWAGGPVPSPIGYPQRPTKLAGVDYATAGHGLLAIDSNKGVTLDLNVLRRAHPLLSPGRFRCGVGNSYTVARRNPLKSDIFVIVDGKSRFEHRGLTTADGVLPIDLPINPDDRFLTLVTTDGGDGIGYDWVLWTDPILTLSPANN